MMRQSVSETRLSLLGRLQQSGLDNAPAWREFVAHYGANIEAWCRHWGLQEADVQDVTQTVLVKLATKMRSFVSQPGGSFRAWLKTLARHAWIDFVADRQRGGAGTATALEELPARDDLEARLAEAKDKVMPAGTLQWATAAEAQLYQAWGKDKNDHED